MARALDVTTFLSHASLSMDERRRAEEAFAQERDCVIVATSTLELGIDVGDLDRVIQLDAPRSVSAFLQRIGRTGRRPGTTRNCLFLALDGDGLLQAAGLLHLWAQGWVEEVVPPPEPRHIVAQQVLALSLQKHRIGGQLWRHEWNDLAPFDKTADVIVRHLLDQGYLDSDSGMLFIGPEAEARFGRRHFMDMLAVFTARPSSPCCPVVPRSAVPIRRCSPRRCRGRDCCYSADAAGASPTSTGSVTSASSSRPRAGVRRSG